jgi:protein phosphatase 1G
MEDAHINKVDLPGDVSVFGVFDGHGGKEVALFVQEHFIDEL